MFSPKDNEYNKIRFIKINKDYNIDCYVDKDKKYFIKMPNEYNSYDVLKREIFILNFLKLKKIDWVPEVLYFDEKKIMMNYCGERISRKNVPENYIIQLKKIFNDLDRLNIRHNDLCDGKKCNMTVYEDKIYVTNFGWGTINDNPTCGVKGIKNFRKPYMIYDDKKAISFISELYNYDDSIDDDIIINNKIITVNGYQNYIFDGNSIEILKNKEKYNKIFETIKKYSNNITTLTDICCGTGLCSLFFSKNNFSRIYSLDKSEKCIDILSQIKEKHRLTNIVAKIYNFGEYFRTTEIVIIIEAIHELYCRYESDAFKNIFEFLNKKASKYFFIEWIEPNDFAITRNKNFNKKLIKEDYNKNEFESNIKIIGSIIGQSIIASNRLLYIIKAHT